MKMMAIAGAAMAMLLSASPAAAQAVDADVTCFLAVTYKANMMTKAGENSSRFDTAGGYYMAIITQRYPSADKLAPVVKAAAMKAAGSSEDFDQTALKCAGAVQPVLVMVVEALDAAMK